MGTSRRQVGSRHTAWPVIAVLAAVATSLSACAGGPVSPGVASIAAHSTPTTASVAASSPDASMYTDELKYSECVRAHGVPNFPDPNAGGGFSVSPGIDRSAPAFAECQKLLPGGGGLGAAQAPTAQALSRMLKVSQCMRRHGISDFPDPRSTIPPLSPSIGVIADRDGVILVFPHGFDEQSPQFMQAAAACGFQVTNH
jgi:hypothetical protein